MTIAEVSAFITDPISLATGLAAIACFATIWTLADAFTGGSKFQSRLKSVDARREQLRKKNRAALDDKGRLRHATGGYMQEIVDKFNIQKLLEDPNVTKKLEQAGFRGTRPVAAYYFFRMVLPVAGFLLVAIYIFLINDHGYQAQVKYTLPIAGAGIGFYLPTLYLNNMLAKRRKAIMKAFPDALDMLLICVEAGMSIERAFQKVSTEVGPVSPELGEELALTTAELSYLPERRQAYENMARRNDHPGVQAVATALIQGERYGTPLGSALRVMAKENRDMRMAEAEKKAAALPAKLTVPMIVFFLPVLFLVILGPAAIRFSENDQMNSARSESSKSSGAGGSGSRRPANHPR